MTPNYTMQSAILMNKGRFKLTKEDLILLKKWSATWQLPINVEMQGLLPRKKQPDLQIQSGYRRRKRRTTGSRRR